MLYVRKREPVSLFYKNFRESPKIRQSLIIIIIIGYNGFRQIKKRPDRPLFSGKHQDNFDSNVLQSVSSE